MTELEQKESDEKRKKSGEKAMMMMVMMKGRFSIPISRDGLLNSIANMYENKKKGMTPLKSIRGNFIRENGFFCWMSTPFPLNESAWKNAICTFIHEASAFRLEQQELNC